MWPASLCAYLAALLWFTLPLHTVSTDTLPDEGSAAALGGRAERSLLDADLSAIRVTRRADGTLRLEESPESDKRPFRLATYYRFRPGENQDVIDFVQDELMPTVASLLARWLRVRHPSGPLNFGTSVDLDMEQIPPGPDGNGAYDADLVMKVTSGVPGSSECRTFYARVSPPVIFEPLTRRPIFGQIVMCTAVPVVSRAQFSIALQFVLHEMIHRLGMETNLFQAWQSARSVQDVIETLPEGERLPPGAGGIGPSYSLKTPNALREARLHFGCPALDSVRLIDDVFNSTVPSEHWAVRLYNGMIMRGDFTGQNVHYGIEAMTDVTLGMLQDTGWYDVKYGSGGFSSYGYQAGCSFVMGTFEEALADPAAARYLCPRAMSGSISCFHDFSGQGICRAARQFDGSPYADDFYTVDMEYDGNTFDCQVTPGSRCLNEIDDDGTQQLICSAGMSCSAAGEVLISGIPCVDLIEPASCPPDDLMCGSPGLLTCATPELNDCNGQGDCCEGRCFCHFGFGGDDCTVPACTSGCPDGTACPSSGFCGVPECGAWSVGDTGTGTPCAKN
eukprot:jgi/Ulvmu1/3692/UM017_0109.1